jgi:hypothetical protein
VGVIARNVQGAHLARVTLTTIEQTNNKSLIYLTPIHNETGLNIY